MSQITVAPDLTSHCASVNLSLVPHGSTMLGHSLQGYNNHGQRALGQNLCAFCTINTVYRSLFLPLETKAQKTNMHGWDFFLSWKILLTWISFFH